MNDIEKLKKLIIASNSLDDEEKKMIIGKIAALNDSEIEQAIEILELEQEKWEELRKDDEASLKIFDEYVDKSNKEIDREYKNTIKKIEKRKVEEESGRAEDLLKKL